MALLPTRSTRGREGLTSSSVDTTQPNSAHNRRLPPSTANRRKHLRDPSDQGEEVPILKKARVALVDSRLNAESKIRLGANVSDAKALRSSQQRPATLLQPKNLKPKTRQPTTHAEKVVNGMKHELNRLQPSKADRKDERRKLRSQEGTRFKSELSAYFTDYDVVIGNEPEEHHFLNIETPIVIIDTKHQFVAPPQVNSHKSRHPNIPHLPPAVRSFSSSLFDDLNDAKRVDFTFLNKSGRGDPLYDPLPDEYYDVAHKRAERLERSIRNSEKGRAQHEKDQVQRLLEGLQGHDWLKVMGVSGITESKKKDYEAARAYFKRGCIAILEKFRSWREEEKRRKLEKDQALAAAADEEAIEDYEEGEEEETAIVDDDDEGNESDGDPPDYSDVDHAAARQLHDEAIFRSTPVVPSKPPRRSRVVPVLAPAPEPEKEFKSFYAKSHLREAALGKRRSGRGASSAFGQPVPEVSQADFDLPTEFKDKELLTASARRRRRNRRESKV